MLFLALMYDLACSYFQGALLELSSYRVLQAAAYG